MKEYEKEYWEINKDLNLIRDITPINIIEEKLKFFDRFDDGERYNPKFQYEITQNFKKLKDLVSLQKELQNGNDWISKKYVELIKNTIKWVKLFADRSANNFPNKITKIYGTPSNTLVSEALRILISEAVIEKEEENIQPIEVKKIMEELIEEENLNGWKVSIENMTSKMSVNNNFKLIKVNKDVKFSEKEIERLKVHEVGTHVRRHENGLKQENLIYAKGFPKYLATEEGLAILSEHKTGVSSKSNMKKYAMRLILSKYCSHSDFFELYNYTQKFFSKDDAFSLVLRIKRGLEDTSNLGGYTKDQVYLKGFINVSRLSNDELKKLFIGKISQADIKDISTKKINTNINMPLWLTSKQN